jgi:Fur family zinc uptake transcriptional regulator
MTRAIAVPPPVGPLGEYEAICRRQGGRLTPQRRAVLTLLLAAQRPLSAYELRDILLPDDPAVTPASIYRCLDFLRHHGLVHRLETTRAFIACFHPDHDHAVQFLICRHCGTVVEAEDEKLAAATEKLGRSLGFAVETRTIELTGTCATCQSES